MNPEEAIESAIDGFADAYNSGDLPKLLGCYGDDLIKMRQGALSENKTEVAARIADVFSKFHSRVDVTTNEIVVEGNIAFTRGSFRVTLRPKADGETQTIERRYLELWRQENGRWLVVRTMDNSA